MKGMVSMLDYNIQEASKFMDKCVCDSAMVQGYLFNYVQGTFLMD